MNQPTVDFERITEKLTQVIEKSSTRAKKAAEVLTSDLETALSTTPYEIVYSEDRMKLKYYKPKEIKHKLPLLVVYALINRETMLDLQPGRSVVQKFLDAGIEVYMIDWGYPTRKDRFLTIDDHVNGYMDNVVEFIRKEKKIDRINLMGICMGGTFSVIYAALHPEKLKNLVTTVTPTHFETDQGLLHVWMKSINPDTFTKTYGNMPADIMNLGFLLLNPARLIIDKYVNFYENVENKDFVENFIRMEKWIFDSPDVPGETFRQFLDDCYHKNLLIQNKMEVGGKRIDLKKIKIPLLNIYGQFDHLVPPEACEKLTQAVGSKDTEDVCLKTGHIGIYVSSKTQKDFAPKISAWLKEREEETEKPKKKTSGQSKQPAKSSKKTS